MPGFVPADEPEFDYKVTTLHEPRPTQVDLFLPGQHGHVAVECKLWEDRLSPCSQVPNKCNGSYASQPGRAPGQRCALTKKKIAYWQYIPQLFTWRADEDYSTCPIWKPYQLVRNVLAAAVDPSRDEVWGQSVTVLVYDANNPGELERTEQLGGKILELCVAVGGTITGEHGVGIEKINQMCVQFTAEELEQFRRVKRAFDPQELLNPGKGVPTPRRCSEYRALPTKGAA